MARNTDPAYNQAQSKQTREAAERYQRPDWGPADPKAREEYDLELSREIPVNGRGGRR